MYDVTQKILEGYDFIKPIGLLEDDDKKDGLYVPQNYKASKNRVEQKMFCSASKYVAKNCNTLLFVEGDMNSDIDGKTMTCINVFKQIYEKMINTDCKKTATWKEKRLDYALV